MADVQQMLCSSFEPPRGSCVRNVFEEYATGRAEDIEDKDLNPDDHTCRFLMSLSGWLDFCRDQEMDELFATRTFEEACAPASLPWEKEKGVRADIAEQGAHCPSLKPRPAAGAKI